MTRSYKIDQRRSYHLKQLDEGKKALRLFDKEKPNLIRTALPSKLIEQILLMYHDQQGHPGVDRTAATIMTGYYWYKMDENIHSYCVGCNYCQSYKANNRVAAIPIQAHGAPTAPYEVVHIDLTRGNFQKSKSGNKFIMVVKCSLTRNVDIIRTIISDQGTEFVNKTIEQLSILLGIMRVKITAGNP